AERADDRPTRPGLERYAVAHAELEGEAIELDPGHEATTADLRHRRMSGERLEQLGEQLDLRREALERALLLEDVERGKRRRAGQRVARVGVAVEEGLELLELAEKALVDLLRRQGGGQRQVAAGDALGQAEQVGRDVLLLAGEHRAGAAEAGGHLVEDEQDVVAVAELADAAQ